MDTIIDTRKLGREAVDSLPPARASLLVEAVLTEKKQSVGEGETKGETHDESTSVSILSKEQLLKIQIKLPDIQDQLGARTLTHLVLVVDNSGSMSGNPWHQVQASVIDIIGRSVTQPNLKTDLIIYADNAHIIDFTADNYEAVINKQKAGGMTNFKAAFTKVNRIVSQAGNDYSKTVIVFMTDGADTVNPKEMLPQMPSKLQERWDEINKEVVIHSVGFSKDHDFTFLKNLSEKGGTTAGMFRYCEPSDSKEALKHKLDELFEFILGYDNDKIQIGLIMDGDRNYFLGGDKPSANTAVQGTITPEDTNANEILVEADAWIQLSDPYDLPTITVTVNTVLALEEGRVPVALPCLIEKTEFSILDKAEDKANWRLKILSRNVDNFIDKVGKAISENGDVGSFQEMIEKFQRQISHTRVFGNGITKERRLEIFEILKDIQKNLDQVQNMLASYVRGGTQSIALLARAHDMRYQAVFSKSRRQRIMDKRVSKNMQQASSAQESLSSLIVNKQEVMSLSQDAVGFYFCMLSQNSIQDILLGDDKEDAIGFGLAVKRNEVVLDEPTMIQIWVISGTLVSRTAMLDALEHKINVSSQLSAHGGFDFAKTQLGVTTVGTAREPINAWLPLYVTKSHWDRVKVILKPALGSFCTLDPLGYDYKQMDVMFMTLGSMIGQLRKDSVGEHQLRLLFALLRTCAACLEDFDMTKQVGEFVENFVSSPAGRTKDIIPNLYTLIGYIVAMPTEQSRKIFCLEGDSASKLPKLWLSLIAEILRRAAGSLLKDTSANVVKGFIDAILHGTQGGILSNNVSRVEPAVCRATAEISRLCLCSTNEEIQVAAFDPSAGVTVPEIEPCHSQKVDRAMEIWAQRQAGYVKNVCKTKAKQTTDAKKLVEQWVAEGYEQLGMENPQNQGAKKKVVVQDEPKASTSTAGDHESTTSATQEDVSSASDCVQSSYNPDHVTQSMLQVLAQLLNKLCHTANPSMLSVPGFIAFVNTWLSKNRNLSEIDGNSGIVPEDWIQEIKEAVTNICGDLEALRQKSNRQPQSVDVLVTGQEGENSEAQTETVINDTGKDSDGDLDNDDLDLYSETDSDELLEDYLSDDSDDEIAFEARRQMKRKRKRQKLFKITVPMILQCIDCDLDVTLMLRGMVCQALRFNRNSDARGAITTTGEFKDLGEGCQSAFATLTGCHRDLQDYRDTVRKGLLDRALWKRANHCMVHASTVWAFIGYLMNIHKDRGEGFNDLISNFVASSVAGSIPYLEKKIHVLLTGKYKDCTVLANGNQWLPEKKMAAVFKNLLGEEKWMEFEVELRSAVQIHVYRESDIPNRHGHCNSNPYIPNTLRLKLGMDLLPEPKLGARAQRRYLRNAKTS